MVELLRERLTNSFIDVVPMLSTTIDENVDSIVGTEALARFKTAFDSCTSILLATLPVTLLKKGLKINFQVLKLQDSNSIDKI